MRAQKRLELHFKCQQYGEQQQLLFHPQLTSSAEGHPAASRWAEVGPGGDIPGGRGAMLCPMA